MTSKSLRTDDELTNDCEQLYTYSTADGTFVITMEDFISLASGKREFSIICRDSDAGIMPFLVAEDGSTYEDIFGLEDEEGVSHVDARLPVPSHFGLTDDDSYLEMSPRGPNGGLLLRRFCWCVFTPLEDDPTGDTYELRFATVSKNDAEFVSKAFGCCDPKIVPVVEVGFEVV